MCQQKFLINMLSPIKSRYAVPMQEARNQAEKGLRKEIPVTVQLFKN